jgi:hypothetical protein
VSSLIRNLLRENMRQNQTYEQAQRRFLSREVYTVNEAAAPYPSRDDIHDRARLR